MTVDRLQFENVGTLLSELDNTVTQLTAISKKPVVNQQDVTNLMSALQKMNFSLQPAFWEGKKLAPEAMNTTIEKALMAVALFQTSGRKDVEQAIASLFSSLTTELHKLDKNLRNLKQLKIGRRVEKSSKSKQA